MKEVQWYIAKVSPKDDCRLDGSRIDLWERFRSRQDAEMYIRADGKDTPFDLVKVTNEVIKPAKKRKKGGK